MDFLTVMSVAVLIGLRVMLVGLVWTAIPWGPIWRVSDIARRGASALAIGLVLNLAPALLLAPANLWSPVWDWFGWVVLILAGLIRLRTRGVCFCALIPQAGLLVALMALLSGVVLIMPPRSEWLAGGWDPGVYQGNAVRIASQHGISPSTDTIYAAMSPEEITIFSRGNEVYREIMPSVPVVREDGRIPLYSFHLTPLCGAWLFRLGGMDTLVRLPTLLGFWMLWLAWALFDRLGMTGWRGGVIILTWMMSPLWWYHQAIPTTEMLYTLLLLGGLLFSVFPVPRIPVAAGLLFFAATVNHLNFPVVWGLLCCVVAGSGGFHKDKHRALIWIACGTVAVAMGVLWDVVFAHITVVRLQEKDQILGWVLGPFAALSVVALIAAWKPLPVRLQEMTAHAVRLIGLMMGVGVLLAPLALHIVMRHAHWYAYIADIPVVGMVAFRMSRFHLFSGIPQVMWTGWGLCVLAMDRDPARRSLRILILALGGVFIAFLLNPGIAEIYPWGLRRYLVVALPLIAVCQGMTIVRFLESWRGRSILIRTAIVGLFLVAIGSSLGHARAAAKMGEYVGLRTLLEEINHHLNPGDVIVVDDPLWGTPLTLIYGHDVVNGQFLWRSEDPEYRAAFIATLERLEDEHDRRIVWLTSTESGIEIYRLDQGSCVPLMKRRPFQYCTVIHSARGSHFDLRDNERVFNLYHCAMAGRASGISACFSHVRCVLR